jgi:hypothetical protein
VLRVGAESGLVVLDLCGRRREVLLPCDVALRLAEAIDGAAKIAESEPAPLSRGEVWGCKVESYDGFVALRFDPPTVGNPSAVPLTPAAARWLADSIRFKEQQAEYKMRFVFQGG